MTFGEKLKAARIESGLKQSELAKKINTTGNTISNWENNVSKPDLDTLSYICGILHVTASYFLQATIPEDEVSIPELKLVKKYRYIAKHSPNGAKTINAVLENEYAIAEQLEKQKDRIEELETSQATVRDIQPHLEVNAAHQRTDIEVTEEMIKHDDDIMDDDDF
ncbi:helix-turn-helix transcriptional regulator [Lachnospiraceae bacterium 56-18]